MTKKDDKYFVVREDSRSDLISAVNVLIDQYGWAPFGGVSVSMLPGDMGMVYCQAMVKNL